MPLYVMLEPEQMDRYKQAADAAKMTMREWVTLALDVAAARSEQASQFWNEIAGADESAVQTSFAERVAATNLPESAELRQHFANHETRLRALEERVKSLQSKVQSDQ